MWEPNTAGFSVVVVRRAYCDAPDNVIASANYKNAQEAIRAYYPDAVFDNRGGFDTSDGGSYLFDDVCVSK